MDKTFVGYTLQGIRINDEKFIEKRCFERNFKLCEIERTVFRNSTTEVRKRGDWKMLYGTAKECFGCIQRRTMFLSFLICLSVKMKGNWETCFVVKGSEGWCQDDTEENLFSLI